MEEEYKVKESDIKKMIQFTKEVIKEQKKEEPLNGNN